MNESELVIDKPLVVFKALLGGAEVMINGMTFIMGKGIKFNSSKVHASNCLLMVFTKHNSDGTTEPHYVRSEMPLDDFIDCAEKMSNEEVLKISVANCLRAGVKKRC